MIKAKDEVIKQRKETYEGEIEALREEMRVVGEAEIGREAEREEGVRGLEGRVGEVEREKGEVEREKGEVEREKEGLERKVEGLERAKEEAQVDN